MSPLGDGGRRRRDGYWVSETVTTTTTTPAPKQTPTQMTFKLPEEPGEGAGVVTAKGVEFYRRGSRWFGPAGSERWRDLLYFDGPVSLSHLPDKVAAEAAIDAQIEMLQEELTPSATPKVNAEVDKVALPEQPGEMGIVIDKDGIAWQRTGEYWTGNAGEKVWGAVLHWHGPVTVIHSGNTG